MSARSVVTGVVRASKDISGLIKEIAASLDPQVKVHVKTHYEEEYFVHDLFIITLTEGDDAVHFGKTFIEKVGHSVPNCFVDIEFTIRWAHGEMWM